MKIAVVGATGNIGARITEEALHRGHAVTALSRHASSLAPRPGLERIDVDNSEPGALAKAMAGHDAVITAVKWNENEVADVVAAIRAAGIMRCLFVVGAGSLKRPDGTLHFDHMRAQGIEPPTSKAAMHALQYFRTVDDLDWTAISPAADIRAGERTGHFRMADDDLVFDDEGKSVISREDFAVAILDELERPQHVRSRFTVGY